MDSVPLPLLTPEFAQLPRAQACTRPPSAKALLAICDHYSAVPPFPLLVLYTDVRTNKGGFWKQIASNWHWMNFKEIFCVSPQKATWRRTARSGVMLCPSGHLWARWETKHRTLWPAAPIRPKTPSGLVSNWHLELCNHKEKHDKFFKKVVQLES